PLKCTKHLVQSFLGRILELIAHAHDQGGIAEGNNFHWRYLVMLSEAKHLCLASRRDWIQSEILRFVQNANVGNAAGCRAFHSPRFASISMLIGTVWLMPETVSFAVAHISLKWLRASGSPVTA